MTTKLTLLICYFSQTDPKDAFLSSSSLRSHQVHLYVSVHITLRLSAMWWGAECGWRILACIVAPAAGSSSCQTKLQVQNTQWIVHHLTLSSCSPTASFLFSCSTGDSSNQCNCGLLLDSIQSLLTITAAIDGHGCLLPAVAAMDYSGTAKEQNHN